MRTRYLFLGLVFVIAGCVWRAHPRVSSINNDTSIVFPRFFERSAVKVEAGAGPYELDGVVLRAISIAANDFLPPSDEEQPCWDRQEAYRYRVIRQGDIIFVRIIEDTEYCGSEYVAVDTGAKYAISTDGRILRRSIGAEPEETVERHPSEPDARPSAAGQHDGGANPPRPELPPLPPAVPDGGSH